MKRETMKPEAGISSKQIAVTVLVDTDGDQILDAHNVAVLAIENVLAAAPDVLSITTPTGQQTVRIRAVIDSKGNPRKHREAVDEFILANCSDDQRAKARQLLADGGLVRLNSTTWLAVASKGDEIYEVSTAHASCTCPAGTHGLRCYHLAAAHLAAA